MHQHEGCETFHAMLQVRATATSENKADMLSWRRRREIESEESYRAKTRNSEKVTIWSRIGTIINSPFFISLIVAALIGVGTSVFLESEDCSSSWEDAQWLKYRLAREIDYRARNLISAYRSSDGNIAKLETTIPGITKSYIFPSFKDAGYEGLFDIMLEVVVRTDDTLEGRDNRFSFTENNPLYLADDPARLVRALGLEKGIYSADAQRIADELSDERQDFLMTYIHGSTRHDCSLYSTLIREVNGKRPPFQVKWDASGAK